MSSRDIQSVHAIIETIIMLKHSIATHRKVTLPEMNFSISLPSGQTTCTCRQYKLSLPYPNLKPTVAKTPKTSNEETCRILRNNCILMRHNGKINRKVLLISATF